MLDLACTQCQESREKALWAESTAIGDVGGWFLVQHNIEHQVYIARAIYDGGTETFVVREGRMRGKGKVSERGSDKTAREKLTPDYLGNPPYGPAEGYMGLRFVPPADGV